MNVNNILAVRTDRFGELLLNIPAFRALKTKFPRAKLSLLVHPYNREIAQCIDCVDEVIVWENKKRSLPELFIQAVRLRKKKFDLCVIFNPGKEFNLLGFFSGIPLRLGYNRKWGFLLTHKIDDLKHLGLKHEVESNLDLVSLLGDAPAQCDDLYLRLEDDTIVEMPRGFDPENLVAVHPWASDPIKLWPAHKFLLLAERLAHELNLKTVFIGGKAEAEDSLRLLKGFKGNSLNLTGKTSLKQLAVLLKRCRALVSADSGPVHLASCVGTPVVAIFRNDLPGKNAARWGPRSKDSVVIENDDLSGISVEEVFNKVKEIVKR